MKAINLEWTPVSDAAAYRLTFRESASGDLVTRSEPFSEPRYSLDPSLADGRDVYARLEVRRNGEDGDEDGWEDAGPTASIPVPAPDEDLTVLRWDGVSPRAPIGDLGSDHRRQGRRRVRPWNDLPVRTRPGRAGP